MNNITNSSNEKRICSICGCEYTQNKYYGYRHTHCTACHQLLGRLKTFYDKFKLGMQMRKVEGTPVFIPIHQDGSCINDLESLSLPTAITEQEAIELLKSKNYKILKPTYIEI